MRFLWLLAGVLFGADQVIKNYILQHPDSSWGVFDWLSINFVPNYGIAFGIQLPQWLIFGLIFIIIAIVVRLGMTAYAHRHYGVVLFLSLIFFGALSNVVDRVLHGFVVDYIDVSFFTVFNLADSMISISVVLLLVQEFFGNTKQKEKSLENPSS